MTKRQVRERNREEPENAEEQTLVFDNKRHFGLIGFDYSMLYINLVLAKH